MAEANSISSDTETGTATDSGNIGTVELRGTHHPERVVRFVGSDARAAQEQAAEKLDVRRDWRGAIDLVNEACEAVRLAEERTKAAEHFSTQLEKYSADLARKTEARIGMLERKLEVAEARANEAEEWLLKFHDAIVNGFGEVLRKA